VPILTLSSQLGRQFALLTILNPIFFRRPKPG
jgi:hypothetical protein